MQRLNQGTLNSLPWVWGGAPLGKPKQILNGLWFAKSVIIGNWKRTLRQKGGTFRCSGKRVQCRLPPPIRDEFGISALQGLFEGQVLKVFDTHICMWLI